MRISADAGAWKIGAKKGRVCASRSTFPRMSKKLYIKTYGCQMNEYDSAKMSDVLAASHGLALVESAEEADVLLRGAGAGRGGAGGGGGARRGGGRGRGGARPERGI